MKSITRRRFFESAGVAAAMPIVGTMPALAQQPATAGGVSLPDVRIESDIVFGKGGDTDLQLDVYHPAAGSQKRMAIVHYFGGGFFTGSKTGVASSARTFAGLGYVSIASQYRLQQEARWPAQIEDAKAAIRWTRANASRLNIDPDRIAVAGYSAGALLALVAAGSADRKDLEGTGGNNGVSSKAAACISFYGLTTANANLLPEGASQADIQAASAASLISPDFAPTVFLHGLEDRTIPPESSLEFFQKLRSAGVKVDLHFFQGADHAYEIGSPDAALASAQVSDLFLERLIINPREYPSFGMGGGGRGGRGGGRGGAGGGRGAGRGAQQ